MTTADHPPRWPWPGCPTCRCRGRVPSAGDGFDVCPSCLGAGWTGGPRGRLVVYDGEPRWRPRLALVGDGSETGCLLPVDEHWLRQLAARDSTDHSWERMDGWDSELEPRACRGCGCTDEDCSACVEATGYPCAWVTDDLCTRCQDEIFAAQDRAAPILRGLLEALEHLPPGPPTGRGFAGVIRLLHALAVLRQVRELVSLEELREIVRLLELDLAREVQRV